MSVSQGLQYSNEEFKAKLGLSKDTFEFLHHVLGSELMKRHNGGHLITNTREQLLIGLWKINNSAEDPFSSVAKRFKMRRSTVVVSVRRVKKALRKVAPMFNDWPTPGNGGVLHFNDKLYTMLPDETTHTQSTLANLEVENVVGIVEKSYRLWKSLQEANKAKLNDDKLSQETPSRKGSRKRPANSSMYDDDSDPDFKDPKFAADLMKEHIEKYQAGHRSESQLSALGLLLYDSGIEQCRPASPLRTKPVAQTKGSEKWPNDAVWALLNAYQKHSPERSLAYVPTTTESPIVARIVADLRDQGFRHTGLDCIQKLQGLRHHYRRYWTGKILDKPEGSCENPKWLFLEKCAEIWPRPDKSQATPYKPPPIGSSGSEKWPVKEVAALLNSYEKNMKLKQGGAIYKLVAEDLEAQGIFKTSDDCWNKIRALKNHYMKYKWKWADGERPWIFTEQCAKIFERHSDDAEPNEPLSECPDGEVPDVTLGSTVNVHVEVVYDNKEGNKTVVEEFASGDDPSEGPPAPKRRRGATAGPSKGHSTLRSEPKPFQGSLAQWLELSLLQEEKFAEAERQRHRELMEADEQLLQIVTELIKKKKTAT